MLLGRTTISSPLQPVESRKQSIHPTAVREELVGLLKKGGALYLAEGEADVLALLAPRKLQAGHHLTRADGEGSDSKGHKEGRDARRLQRGKQV